MEFLKLFQNHSEYEAFVSGGTMVKPNVSHCINENEVHYNPIETRLIVKYNVIDANNNLTQLYNYDAGENITANLMFDKVEVDDIEVPIADLDVAEGEYPFSVGEHTVKYTLKDPTSIKSYAFAWCCITSVVIPNSVTTIEDFAFRGCSSLTSVTIPDSVTSIGGMAFGGCTGLTSVTIGNSVTSIESDTFCGCSSLDENSRNTIMTINSSASFGNCVIK